MQKQIPALKRVVSAPMLTLYGLGNIVGAGIYVLIGKVTEPAGYLSIIAFIVAALVAFCAALAYAELAGRFPVSAGISVYLYEAFRKKGLSTIIGLLLVLAGTVSSAVLLKGFTGYFHSLVPWPPMLITILITVLLTTITLRGIQASVRSAAILTIIEVGGLLFLIGSILFAKPEAIAVFNTEFTQSLSVIDTAALSGVIAASFIAFYAFVGFEDMVNIAEEVKNPQKAFPKAILGAMAIVTVLYIAVAVVALGVLPPSILGSSGAPLADAYKTATGNATGIIVIVSLIATLNGVLVNIIMCSRFLYGLSGRGWITPWFSKVSRFHVPARGLLVIAAIALLCALWLPIENLAQITSLLLLFVFLAVNVSLIIIRRHDAKEERKLRISPHFLPWIGALAAGGLLIGQVLTMV